MQDREITVMRKRGLFNNGTDWYIQIDGQDYDIIHGGEIKKIRLDEKQHVFLVHSNDPKIGKVDKVYIPEGHDDYVYHVDLSTALIGNSFMSYIKIKQL